MAMSAQEIESHLLEAFPDADIDLVDLAGDNNHFQVTVTSSKFTGLNRIKQHQLVYDALKGNMGGVLHALSVKTIAK